MVGLMANCFAWLKSKNKPPKDVKLVIIGLDDAGKTTTVACLQGEPPDGITPTVGFSNANLKFGKCNVTLYDLGGGVNVRTVWKKYFAEIYGIIFTIDSCNKDRIEESRDALSEIFQDPKVSGKPILIFANKQDKEGALDVPSIKKKLKIQTLSKKYEFKYNVFPCSAIKGFGNKTDKSIRDGFNWLLSAVNNDYQTIHEKVEHESKIQKEQEAKERKEKWDRIRKERAEREKAAQEAGVNEDEGENNEDDDDVMSGPFRNINDQIKITEKREKKEKENRKKIKAYMDNKANEEEDIEDDETDSPPKKNKSKKKKGKTKKKRDCEDDEDDDTSPKKDDLSNVKGSRDSGLSQSYEELERPLPPPPSKGKKKKKKKIVQYEDEDEDGEEDEIEMNNSRVIMVNSSENVKESNNKRRSKQKLKKSKHLDESDDDNVRNEEEEDARTSQEKMNDSRAEMFRARSSDALQSSENLNSSNVKKSKKKTKKKKKEQNGNVISNTDDTNEDELERESEPPQHQTKKKKKKKKNRTEPNNVCQNAVVESSSTSNDALLSANGSRQMFAGKLPPIRENGHTSKLEPIELRGRLPDIGNHSRQKDGDW
eukprot:TCONS_00015424-protein